MTPLIIIGNSMEVADSVLLLDSVSTISATSLTSNGHAVEVPFLPTIRISRTPICASGAISNSTVIPPLAFAADFRYCIIFVWSSSLISAPFSVTIRLTTFSHWVAVIDRLLGERSSWHCPQFDSNTGLLVSSTLPPPGLSIPLIPGSPSTISVCAPSKSELSIFTSTDFPTCAPAGNKEFNRGVVCAFTL